MTDNVDSTAERQAASAIEQPPTSVFGILLRLGPGLIIAGNIVGSGELIATTATGAQAGFWLLWVIVIGCVIKVFVQVEMGRYAVTNRRTTLSAMSEVPGPRVAITPRGRAGNWLVWYWLAMVSVSIGQLGGIVGGVGQSLAITMPLTERGRAYNAEVEARTKLLVAEHESGADRDTEERRQIAAQIAAHDTRIADLADNVHDHKYWASIIAVVTAIVLVVGRYRFIQSFAALLVASFTLITVFNVLALQAQSTYAVSWSDLVNGFSFRLTPKSEALGPSPLATALATFGIIGVGASELISYPYWCLEKGYARYIGPRDGTPEWAERARGWMRVMRWDAWSSMVLYTFATVAFYLLGAAILGRLRLNPEGTEMVRTLSIMYEPVFGEWAGALFLFGAFAVLYSTYFVSNASNARMFADVFRVLGITSEDERAYRRRVTFFSGLLPFLCLAVYIVFPQPTKLVLASGVMQATMLPMLSGAAIYFRYRRTDAQIAPGRLWDVCLWLSALGMLLAGAWLAVTKVFLAF